MFHRTALFAASLAAAMVLATGLALTGFAPSDPSAGVPAAEVTGAEPAAAATGLPASTDPQIQVDTVYLTPQATPKVIIHKVTKVKTATRSGGGEGEHEGGDDD